MRVWAVALGRALVIVERHARRDDVDQREAVVPQRRLENRNELRLVAREAARNERRAQAEREQDRVDGALLVRLAALALRADIGGCRELPLGEAVHAVVLDDVEHVEVAADGVAHLAEADRERVAVAGDADVGEVDLLAALAPVAMAGMRP